MLALLLFLSSNSGNSAAQFPEKNTNAENGILERMIVANGNVTMDLDLNRSTDAPALVSGPDIVVGDLLSVIQSGSSGTQVGLSIGVTACNNGDRDLDFFALPNADHPVIAQNLYRMSGGATHDDRFEQVGQSWLRHLFSAVEQNDCGFGCTPSGDGGTHLGAGCSDAESASSNGAQNGLGSRAWVNPLTGVFPGPNPNPADHTGHTHTGVSHRILVESDDLNTTLNSDATLLRRGSMSHAE